ncbi:GGDEF domain-containing protein [Arthrobacter celericrescens]|uniref:GGDEF domain-containing protein n=1 Tax=Arthrobacter celericrescens TaxID=2320851 RepID=UPI000EA0459B|nr:GGDEF domain-containing protein [Arthrobacter celericrescens]
MVLDTVTLRVALGVVTLTLFVLFYSSFRRTRSRYSGWWSVALLFFLTGNLALLLNGTPHQAWANPAGNVLLVTGAFSVWAGSRSLRLLGTPRWLFAAGPAFTAVASLLDSPGSDTWSGGLAYLGMMTVGIALASRELWLLKPGASQVHRTIAVAAGFMAAYYCCRWVVYLVDGPLGPVFRTYFNPAMTSLITLVLLVSVSYSMTALSNEQLINGLSERATRDGLTGLLNRSAFMELASEEVRRVHAKGSVAALILADLDHFKTLNDVHGHSAGDAAIKAFASACLASVRSTDFVARYGGEEFVILLPGANLESAKTIAAAISRRLTDTKAEPVLPTVSYGVALSTGSEADLAGMISEADAALYKAKAQGRNRVVCAGSPSQ